MSVKAKTQDGPRPSDSISDLPYATLQRLGNRLDLPCGGNQLYWRQLIEVMPEGMYDQLTVNRFAMNANRLDGSPGYALLTDMGNRGVTFEQLVTYLKSMNFDVALRELGYKEEVQFTRQPEAKPAVVGQRLVLECEASGVPQAKFLWFKERAPLPGQTSNRLVLEKVSKADEGSYCCRASNDLNLVFSNWVEVTVQQPVRDPPKAVPAELPEILTQPQAEVRAHPGQEVRLVVVAHGHDTLSYQWYCDACRLPYGTSRELILPQVTPDQNGMYTCSITSPSGGSVMSSPARVLVSPLPQTLPQQLPRPAFSQPPIPTPVLPLQPQQQAYAPPQWVPHPAPAEYVAYEAQNGQFSHHPSPSPHITGLSELPSHLPQQQQRPSRNLSSHSHTQQDGPVGEDVVADPTQPCYDKVALLIGNRHYHHGRLKLNTPEADTQDLAGILRSADFKVVSLVNLTKQEMDQAVEYFTSLLGKNVYALFFFAGHGFEYNGMNYMMAVDATMDKNPAHCLCAQKVQHTMQSHGAKLSIVLLDMCRVRSHAQPHSEFGSEGVYCSPPRHHEGYFVYGFSCSPAERAYEISHSGPASRPEERENSIFVAALKEHVQKGTLATRVDRLLTEAAEEVRLRGVKNFPGTVGWQKPEIRSNLGEALALTDPVSRAPEMDGPRTERLELWRKAHRVPSSVVVAANDGELVARLHFEAEHTNVLVVTVELLNGCLASTEIETMTAKVVNPHIPEFPVSKRLHTLNINAQ
jgi:hypothetical protein